MNLKQRLIEISKTVPVIDKDGVVRMGNSEVYVTTYDNVISVLKPALDQYGIIITCNGIDIGEFAIREVKTKNGSRDAFHYHGIYTFEISCSETDETTKMVVPATSEAFDSKVATYAYTIAWRQCYQKLFRTTSGENEEAATIVTQKLQNAEEVEAIMLKVKAAESVDELTRLHNDLKEIADDYTLRSKKPFFSARKNQISKITDDVDEKSDVNGGASGESYDHYPAVNGEVEVVSDIEKILADVKIAASVKELSALYETLGGITDASAYKDKFSARRKELEADPKPSRKKSTAKTKEFSLNDPQFKGDVADEMFECLEDFGVSKEDAVKAWSKISPEIENAWGFNDTPKDEMMTMLRSITIMVRANDKLAGCSLLNAGVDEAIEKAGADKADIAEKLGVKGYQNVLIGQIDDIMRIING